MDDKKFLKTSFLKLLEEIEPQKLINNSCGFDGKTLKVKNSLFDLSNYKNIYIFGSGKAVLPMAKGLQKILKNITREAFLTGAFKDNMSLKNTVYMQSSHPLPSQQSIESAKKLKQKLEELKKDDFYIYLLSGGTSSLLELPENGINLQEIKTTTDLMLKSAMSIEKMNCVRRHISQIKGGKLAQNIKADGIVLVLSDVLSDDLRVIGSGPLHHDSTTATEAISYLKEHNILDKIPKAVKESLSSAKTITCKHKSKEIEHFIIGSNGTVLKKAKEILQKDIETVIIEKPLKNEVKEEVKRLLGFAKTNSQRRVCLLFGGECTVKVEKDGYGGRNQHLALSFLEQYDFDFKTTLLCGATDGVDGNSSAAGAIIQTSKTSKQKRDEIAYYLKNFNSNVYFKKTGDLLQTSPTHNNLLDITMMIIN